MGGCEPRGTSTARSTAPSLAARRALTPAELQAAATAPSTRVPAEDAFGLWDFAADMSTDRVTDRSPSRAARPDRERAQARGHRPQLERHRDGLASGARAVRRHPLPRRRPLRRRLAAEPHHHHPAGRAQRRVRATPVRPTAAPTSGRCSTCARPRRGPRAPVAFLASTATYLAYSNYRARMRPGPAELYIGALPVVDPTDLLLMHHPELGGSTYDTHSDGSGVCHVSWRRPILNVRPTGRLWNLFLDFCLLDWLEAHDQPYDVITDDDLHAEGRAASRRLSASSSPAVIPSTTRARCWTRSPATSAAAAGSCTWAATASTGASRIRPPTPG